MDDLFEVIAKNQAAADALVEPWQTELKPGDHFLRLAEYGSGVLAIYGKVEELKYAEDRELYALPRMKHYRPTRCYSVVCPEGEYGDIHISTAIKKLNRIQFNMAEEQGWPSDAASLREILELS